MPKSEFVKCRYAHCKHDGEKIRRDEAIKVGAAYYHPDCYAEKEKLHEIEKYYIEHFDMSPIMSMLRKTINNIIFTKKMDPDYVIYAMKYAKTNHIPVRNPAGLYYITKDWKIETEWEKHLEKKNQAKVAKMEFKVEDDLKPVEGYGAQKANGFKRAFA